jgi:hypothetical protein
VERTNLRDQQKQLQQVFHHKRYRGTNKRTLGTDNQSAADPENPSSGECFFCVFFYRLYMLTRSHEKIQYLWCRNQSRPQHVHNIHRYNAFRRAIHVCVRTSIDRSRLRCVCSACGGAGGERRRGLGFCYGQCTGGTGVWIDRIRIGLIDPDPKP